MKKNIQLSGLKKAVGDYQRANEGGVYSPRYGYMMLDRNTRELWTDEFYNLGHNSWKEYHDPAIINLVRFIRERVPAFEATMISIKEYAAKVIAEYDKEKLKFMTGQNQEAMKEQIPPEGKEMKGFVFITKSLQEAYEQGTKGSLDKTPDICGYYGRACQQMEKSEGANRALCQGCGLAKYCE